MDSEIEHAKKDLEKAYLLITTARIKLGGKRHTATKEVDKSLHKLKLAIVKIKTVKN